MLGLAVVLVSVLGACERPMALSKAGAVMLRVPGSEIVDVAWPPDESVFLSLMDGEEGPMEVVEVERSQVVRRLPSGHFVACANPWLVDLSVLPDGELGIVGDCGPELPRVALKLIGARVKELAELPAGTIIAWNSGMKDGWIEYIYSGCRGIAQFKDRHVVSFPNYHPAELMPWDVDRDFFSDKYCNLPGRAGFATPSSSKELYFLASREERGVMSSDAEWDLLAFAASTGGLRRIAGGFRRPVDLDVTPNGRALLISSTLGASTGVWQIDVETGKIALLAKGELFGSLSPSPNSRYVAVARTVIDQGSELITLKLKGV